MKEKTVRAVEKWNWNMFVWAISVSCGERIRIISLCRITSAPIRFMIQPRWCSARPRTTVQPLGDSIFFNILLFFLFYAAGKSGKLFRNFKDFSFCWKSFDEPIFVFKSVFIRVFEAFFYNQFGNPTFRELIFISDPLNKFLQPRESVNRCIWKDKTILINRFVNFFNDSVRIINTGQYPVLSSNEKISSVFFPSI